MDISISGRQVGSVVVVDGVGEEIEVGRGVWYSPTMVVGIRCIVAVSILGETGEVVVVGKRVRHLSTGKVSVEV